MIDCLKKEVLNTFGEGLIYTKDCKFLAEEISDVTGERISPTTIRRLFGFLKCNSAPSRYTLSVLAKFAGFESLEIFEEHCQKVKSADDLPKESWVDFHTKALEFSKETYNLIAAQSGIPFSAVVARNNAEQKIEKFLRSDKKAMSFVAPGGYGKSTLLAKWFENNWLKKHNNDVVLFLNASFMQSCLNNDFKLDLYIQEQLQLNEKESLKHFLTNSKLCSHRVVIVIDALDEVTYDNNKLSRLFLQLNQFIINYKGNNKLKLIITSRNTTWQKFALPSAVKGNEILNCWYDLDLNVDQVDKINIEPLSLDEIQYVFDQTLNTQFQSYLSSEELSLKQRKIISNPFFLELFVKLYSPERMYQLDKGQDLIVEYLKNKIFYSRFSDEKMDIINGFLKLIDFGKNGLAVKKMNLRELYPIHLKTGGDYYQAYEELVSFGLFTEYISINELSSYCKYVKFTNEILLEELISMTLIQQNGGANFDLLKKVENDYEQFDLKNRLMNQIVSYLILNGQFDDIKRVFELNNNSLKETNIIDNILKAPVYSRQEREAIVEVFIENKSADCYLFNCFCDDCNLTTYHQEILTIVAQKGKSKNIRVKALGILLRDSILSLNYDCAKKYYSKLQDESVDTSCSGYAISIKLAGTLLYNHFIGDESNDIVLLKIFYYREMAYVHYNNFEGKLIGEFELIMCLTLLMMKSYHKVIQLVDDYELFSKDKKNIHQTRNYRLLQCYKLFAHAELGTNITKVDMQFLQQCKADVELSGNIYLKIYYYSFLISKHFENGEKTLAEEVFNRAIEISESLDLQLYSGMILSKMAKIYNKWGEKTKEELCRVEGHKILSSKHLNKEVKLILE